MPSAADIPPKGTPEYATESPMAFRRKRFWFLSFLMTPFRDIDNRIMDQPTPREPGKRRVR